MQAINKYFILLNCLKSRAYYPTGESGFILVLTMFILIVLTLIGLSAISTTEIELQIAGNDRVHKETFYLADGGSETGIQLVEENVSCPKGFTVAAGFDNNDPSTFRTIQGVQVADAKFAFDETIGQMAASHAVTDPANLAAYPSDTARSVRIPFDPAAPSDATPHTNLAIWGETRLSAGSAIQMAAGYEGKGKSAGSSGAYIAYQIHSQHLGLLNSQSIVRTEWRHLVGQEGDCNY